MYNIRENKNNKLNSNIFKYENRYINSIIPTKVIGVASVIRPTTQVGLRCLVHSCKTKLNSTRDGKFYSNTVSIVSRSSLNNYDTMLENKDLNKRNDAIEPRNLPFLTASGLYPTPYLENIPIDIKSKSNSYHRIDNLNAKLMAVSKTQSNHITSLPDMSNSREIPTARLRLFQEELIQNFLRLPNTSDDSQFEVPIDYSMPMSVQKDNKVTLDILKSVSSVVDFIKSQALTTSVNVPSPILKPSVSTYKESATKAHVQETEKFKFTTESVPIHILPKCSKQTMCVKSRDPGTLPIPVYENKRPTHDDVGNTVFQDGLYNIRDIEPIELKSHEIDVHVPKTMAVNSLEVPTSSVQGIARLETLYKNLFISDPILSQVYGYEHQNQEVMNRNQNPLNTFKINENTNKNYMNSENEIYKMNKTNGHETMIYVNNESLKRQQEEVNSPGNEAEKHVNLFSSYNRNGFVTALQYLTKINRTEGNDTAYIESVSKTPILILDGYASQDDAQADAERNILSLSSHSNSIVNELDHPNPIIRKQLNFDKNAENSDSPMDFNRKMGLLTRDGIYSIKNITLSNFDATKNNKFYGNGTVSILKTLTFTDKVLRPTPTIGLHSYDIFQQQSSQTERVKIITASAIDKPYLKYGVGHFHFLSNDEMPKQSSVNKQINPSTYNIIHSPNIMQQKFVHPPAVDIGKPSITRRVISSEQNFTKTMETQIFRKKVCCWTAQNLSLLAATVST